MTTAVEAESEQVTMTDASNTMLSPRIAGKLRSLRRLLRGRLAAEGFCWVVVACVVGWAVSLGLDYGFRLDRTLRGIISGLCGLGILTVAGRWLVGPMLVGMPLRDVALLVEGRYGQLEDRVISALELTPSAAESAGMSAAMVDRVAAQADALAGGLSFGRVVEKRRLRRSVVGAVVALTVLISAATTLPGVMRLWFERNVLLAEIDWPQRTYLSVYATGPGDRLDPMFVSAEDGTIERAGGSVNVLRGGRFDVVVVARGEELPERVVLHALYPSMGRTESRLERLPPEAAGWALDRLGLPAGSSAVYRKRFDPVREAMTFYATGGDDRRDGRQPHRVRLVDPPGLERMTLAVTFPAYMKRSGPTVLEGIRGLVSVPLGARLELSGRARKELASASLRVDGERAGAVRIEPDEAGANRRVVCSLEVFGENEPQTRKLAVLLEDVEGWRNERGEQLLLQVLPDQPPSVVLRSSGVGTNKISPRARIPLRALAQDDHGVGAVRVLFRIEPPDEATAVPDSATTGPAESGAEDDVGFRLVGEATEGTGEQAELTVERELDIQPMGLPLDTQVHMRAEVADLLPARFGGPNTGRSGTLTLRVVSVEELLAELVTRQKKARMAFFQSANQQKLVQGRCEQVAEEARQGKAGAEPRRRIVDAITRLQDIVNDAQKIAADYGAVADELEYNRLAQPVEVEALREEIVEPLGDLAGQLRGSSAELQGLLDVEGPEALADGSGRAVQTQQDIAETMEGILKRMQRLENRLDLAHRLEGLLKMSIELEAMLQKRLERKAEDIFDPAEE